MEWYLHSLGKFIQKQRYIPIGFGVVFAVIGAAFLVMTRAETNGTNMEAESGTLTTCTQVVSDSEASNLNYVELGTSGCGTPSEVPGASLPVFYDVATLTGTVRYVSTTGNDTTGTGTVSAPYATVARAITASASNDSIVIRGGTYREGNISTGSKSLKIAAYPGELPIFNGAVAVSSGWVVEGDIQYHAYTPQPVTNGSGIDFINNQNLASGGLGKYPDQAWVGTTQLRQVGSKTEVVEGTFWVDSGNSRIYLATADITKGSVEYSEKDVFIDIASANTVLEGMIITRFSNTASDGGVVKVLDAADNAEVKNVAIYDSAFIAIQYLGSSNLLTGAKLIHTTIENSNWMGVNTLYTDSMVMSYSKINNMNQFGEFLQSPQSGALKTSRTRYTKVLNNVITNNKSHGLWFDQSNVDVDVAANWIVGNTGSGVFFEISDDLLMINNYIEATASGQAVKLAGSSGLKLVNNTLVGGVDPLGIYTDERSKPGCADPAQPLCTNSYNSDRDTVRTLPATLDWMPRVDLMINNIIANPVAPLYCSRTTVCILVANGSASAPIQTIFHQAEPGRGIPQTVIDNNVYVNGTGSLIHAGSSAYSSLATFTAAMANAPVSIPGLDANSKSGTQWVNVDGTSTASLQAAHNEATAVPSDPNINEYIQAGNKHYGVTWR